MEILQKIYYVNESSIENALSGALNNKNLVVLYHKNNDILATISKSQNGNGFNVKKLGEKYYNITFSETFYKVKKILNTFGEKSDGFYFHIIQQ